MIRFDILSTTAVLGLSLAVLATPAKADGCSSGEKLSTAKGKDIVETALAAGEFKTLAAALTAADLVKPLQGEGPFTVFAPNDAAFAQIPEKELKALLEPENREALTTILTFHVVPGRWAAKDVVKMNNAASLNGQRLDIQVNDDGVTIAGARVTKTDVSCSNGIIHFIDRVMLPSTSNIVETAVEAKSFTTLAAALQAGDLVEALIGDGPFTVFAPTDEAFAALPAGTIDSLLKPENKEKLIAVLMHHVVPGRVYSDQLATGQIETLGGTKIDVRVTERAALIGGSTVSGADIDATNGVIHVIDKVLLPN